MPSKEYYAKNKEKLKIKRKEDYEKNKEKTAIYFKKWKSEHLEHCAKEQRKFRKTKKGKLNAKLGCMNHRHLKRVGKGVTPEQWRNKVDEYNYRCAYCGKLCNLTVDHITPLNKGGEHSIENVVPACMECNCKKGVSLWKPKIFRKVS